MRMRRSAAAVALAVAVVVPTAVTGVAAYAKSPSPAASSVVTDKKPKPDNKKKTPFQASGTVTGVDAAAGTVTVAARSGTKDVRGKTVTMTVAADARIVLNGKKVKLAALAAGLKVSVTGTRTDTAYLAGKIQAAGKVKPAPSPSTPTTPPTASPSPSDSVSPAPTESSSPAPTESSSPAPTESSTPEPTESSEPTGSPEPSED
ncbi:hypothetical protein Q0Z83_004270 [Actinoplanes sichuanensis]|uniref:DUF5666 domain-containing protein n=1 Tax=Actinoplanes sichuanensis TaxID=512349 RepID=A0ABW4AGC2_9ACTN|nr:hypothetical protein [Actinoplanes sichuanensis]BEL02236.1 hypothetical protein Q0Z83_004270 [Actinoplanes sichuanensis]